MPSIHNIQRFCKTEAMEAMEDDFFAVAIAFIMALARAIRCGNENGENVYDSRGILVL